jgi:hypothetical protein
MSFDRYDIGIIFAPNQPNLAGVKGMWLSNWSFEPSRLKQLCPEKRPNLARFRFPRVFAIAESAAPPATKAPTASRWNQPSNRTRRPELLPSLDGLPDSGEIL